jgi:formylglycine-generating enzyme required for sulfatase activity
MRHPLMLRTVLRAASMAAICAVSACQHPGVEAVPHLRPSAAPTQSRCDRPEEVGMVCVHERGQPCLDRMHRPRLPFMMDIREVSVADYGECVRAGICPRSTSQNMHGPETGDPGESVDEHCNGGFPERGALPMNCVDWSTAATYCNWRGKRLPSAEEWRYAACGCDGRTYPWGNEPPTPDRVCSAKPYPGETATCSVGTHPLGAGASGTQDTGGNVAEWTTSPHDTSDPPWARIVLGGASLQGPDWNARCSESSWDSERSRLPQVGFRCVK